MYMWVRRGHSYITTTLVASLVSFRAGKLVKQGIGQEIKHLMAFLQLDPAIDVTPKRKDLLDQIERILLANISVYNSKNKMIYCGDKSRLDGYCTQIPLYWSYRSWALISGPDHFLGCPQMPALPSNVR